jgi:DNA-binding NarL/FixJ family response regulator
MTNLKPIRVLVVDDHAIVREGLRMILENDPQIEVVGEAGSNTDALAIVTQEQPDVILLDLDLAGESSLDILRDLRARSEPSRVLILTGVRDPQMHQRAVILGALGVLMKEQAGKTLLKAIRKVHAGEAWLDRTMTGSILNQLSRLNEARKDDPEDEKITSLTPREREIVALITQGLVNKDIAERLFIGEKTVRNNLTTIYSKLGVSNRLELAVYASRHGLGQ